MRIGLATLIGTALMAVSPGVAQALQSTLPSTRPVVHPEFDYYPGVLAQDYSSVSEPIGGFLLIVHLEAAPAAAPAPPSPQWFRSEEAIPVTVRLYDLRRDGKPQVQLSEAAPILRLRHKETGVDRDVAAPAEKPRRWTGGAAYASVEPYQFSWSIDLTKLDPPLADGHWTIQAVIPADTLQGEIGHHEDHPTPPVPFVMGDMSLKDAIEANHEETKGEGEVELRITATTYRDTGE